MSLSFDTIVDINNKAVHHFESMRLTEAKEMFRKAIDCVYGVLSLEINQDESTDTSNHTTLPLHAGWSQTPTTTKCVSSASNAEVFVFSRTVLLCLQPYHASLSRVYLSLLLYNLAVTVHLEATVRSSSTHFEGACRLYDMGFNMLKQTGYAKAGGDFDLVLISMLNNAGAIFFSELMRYRDAQRCFLAVSKLMTTRPFNTTVVLNDNEVGELLMNLYVQEVSAAPAA